ncbi:MAG: PilN domain-containing protein [Bacteriovoracaceae bacterium]
MIEINLSPSRKEASLTNIGGIDLSLINVKMIVLALVILYVPEGFIESYYEEAMAKEQAKQVSLNKEYREIRGKVAAMGNIEKQVDALKDRETKLAKKLEVVKQIINKRQNPFKVFKYLSENIPEGVWLTSLELNDKDITMQGYSKNFKNIGNFLENLKNSIFFQKNISYERPESIPNMVDDVHLEVFEIKATVASFE